MHNFMRNVTRLSRELFSGSKVVDVHVAVATRRERILASSSGYSSRNARRAKTLLCLCLNPSLRKGTDRAEAKMSDSIIIITSRGRSS